MCDRSISFGLGLATSMVLFLSGCSQPGAPDTADSQTQMTTGTQTLPEADPDAEKERLLARILELENTLESSRTSQSDKLDIREMNRELTTRIDSIENENKMLNRQLERAMNSTTDMSDASLETLGLRNQKLEEEIIRLQQMANNTEQEMQTRVEALTTELQTIQSQYEEAELRLDTSTQHLQDANAQIEVLTGEIDALDLARSQQQASNTGIKKSLNQSDLED